MPAPLLRTALLFSLLAPAAAAEPPVIPDGPVTIDPAQFLPEPLRAKATADFTESSLRELVAWLRDERGLSVVVHEREILNQTGLTLSDRISDRLEDAPLYQLLNRLRQLDLAWWYQDDVLHLSTVEENQSHLVLATYPVGDLIDRGLDADTLIDITTSTISVETWANNGGGEAEIRPIGDLLFVTQQADTQREVAALLQGLRTHGRRTWVNDPAEHETLRAKLEQPVTVDFEGKALVDAIAELADQADVRIHLDRYALQELGIRERKPVRLRLADRPLGVTAKAMLSDLGLTCIPRDGVLLVTTRDETLTDMLVAVYDVRDLCQNDSESYSLIEAITNAVAADTWADNGGGEAEIRPTPAGALVISQTESVHDEVLRLLEMYREALRNSKPREQAEPIDPDEVVTVYYRLHRDTAKDLTRVLPTLVAPESWASANRPKAAGLIQIVNAPPEYKRTTDKGAPAVTPQAVLIIDQTRVLHKEVADVIGRISTGDSAAARRELIEGLPPGGGGLGGGGGGFGSGYYSVEDR